MRMVLPLVRLVLLEVTGTVEELLERKTFEDLLKNLLLVGADDDDDDERRRRNTLEDFLESLLLEEVVRGRRRGPCRGQKPLVGAKFERVHNDDCNMIPLRVDMQSRVSVRPLLTGHKSGEDGPLWEEILCALSSKTLSYTVM